MAKFLVTGASGFIGRAIVNSLLTAGASVVAVVRERPDFLPDTGKQVVICDLVCLLDSTAQDAPALLGMPTGATRGDSANASCIIRNALQDVCVVIHAAARTHLTPGSLADPLVEFRKTNRDTTLTLARLAASIGVKRFVFLSSIKVNGEMTKPDQCFYPDDTFVPTDPYALSKYEAEQGLLALAKETGMEVVIIRPPLVYGPGVKANFHSMMRWIRKGVPLPLGAIRNKRSLVALDNLVDLIVTCIEHPAAANQTFLAGDGEDLSTSELLERMGKALGKPARLIPVPVSLLTYIAWLLGKRDVAQRLCGSLQVDVSKARELLGWEPPVSVEEGLRMAAESFKKGL